MCMGSRDAVRMCGNVLQVWPGAGLAGEEGAGTCGAWLERIQISSQAASVSHPPSSPRPTQAPTLGDAWRAWLWCDDVTRVARTSLSQCASDAASAAASRAWDGKWWQVRIQSQSQTGARSGLGMYRSMTRSHASLEIRAGKHHHPRTCTRKSRGTNHHCAVCAEDWFFFGASESIIGNSLAKSPTPVLLSLSLFQHSNN